jgi:hypothetical protein
MFGVRIGIDKAVKTRKATSNAGKSTALELKIEPWNLRGSIELHSKQDQTLKMSVLIQHDSQGRSVCQDLRLRGRSVRSPKNHSSNLSISAPNLFLYLPYLF